MLLHQLPQSDGIHATDVGPMHAWKHYMELMKKQLLTQYSNVCNPQDARCPGDIAARNSRVQDAESKAYMESHNQVASQTYRHICAAS